MSSTNCGPQSMRHSLYLEAYVTHFEWIGGFAERKQARALAQSLGESVSERSRGGSPRVSFFICCLVSPLAIALVPW
jgi:hypothetical protein